MKYAYKLFYIFLDKYIIPIHKYYNYKKYPTFSFYVVNYSNGTSEIVLFKNALKYNSNLSCYNMQIFNTINQPDKVEEIWDLDDCNDFVKKYRPIWSFKQLYNFVKLSKNNKNHNNLYEYSIKLKTRDVDSYLRKHKIIQRP